MRACILLILLAPAAAQALELDYDGALAGVRLARLHLHLETDGPGYLARLHFQTIDAATALARGQTDALAQGGWDGPNPVPLHADSEGVWNGTLHRLVIDWRDGVPVVSAQAPPDQRRHESIPRASFLGATDGLGLIAALLRQIAATGQCDRRAVLAEPHSLTAYSFATGPMQAVAGPLFTGLAHRCDFTSQKTAGFRDGENRRRLNHGYALYAAPGPGRPVVPLRVVFQAGFWGDAVLSLTAVTH